jgi:hypothetical protein
VVGKRIRLYSSLQSVALINLLGVAVLVAGPSSAFSTWWLVTFLACAVILLSAIRR